MAIALGRASVEAGHSVLFVTATSLLAHLARASSPLSRVDVPALSAELIPSEP